MKVILAMKRNFVQSAFDMKSDLHDLKAHLELMESGSSKVQETNKI
jgi:hypothetical protein